MTAVELFAGIGGFRIAAEANHLCTKWANDICPKACSVYRDRFGSLEIQEGDIAGLKEQIPSHDLLTAGFPCQPFSSAGKKEGVRDPRGTLFQFVVDTLAEREPTYFILENVKRLLTMEKGFHFATILSSLAELNYDIEWRLLNAMHFGMPQNRQRVFLIGVHQRAAARARRGVDLRVRLATAEDLCQQAECPWDAIWDYPRTWKPVERHGARFPKWGLARSGRFIAADPRVFSSALPSVKLREVLEDTVSPDFDFTEATYKWISSNTPVNRLVQGVQVLSNQAGGARMGYTIFGTEGVAPTLTSTTSRHYERYKVGDRYRRLTNVEYARIQGFPDDHCRAASVYDQYALFGNAVPPPMASWVIERVLGGGIERDALCAPVRQRDLFSYADQSSASEDPARQPA
jgi:DNA (cytosine-5)-methyltransferase 1